MANLIQAAEELEYVPKDQLAQMVQDPNSRYPSYLVLSEIQRRTNLERMCKAEEASMNQPTTTVAEEVVTDFMQPEGLAGMTNNGSAMTGDFSPDVMPAPPSPLGMAEGGETIIDKWFGNKYLNPFVSDVGTAKWTNPVAALPHVAYQNVMETGEPMPGMPGGEIGKVGLLDTAEALGQYTPPFDLEEYEKRKQEELERLYAENPQSMIGPGGMATGGRIGYKDGGFIDRMRNRLYEQHPELKKIIELKELEEEEEFYQGDGGFFQGIREKFGVKKPQDGMATGGRIGFQNTGSTSRASLLASFGIDPTGMSPAEIEKAIQQTSMMGPGGAAMRGPSGTAPLSNIPVPFDVGQVMGPSTTDIPAPFDVGQVMGPSGGIKERFTNWATESGATPTLPDVKTLPDIKALTEADLPAVDEEGTIAVEDIPKEDREAIVEAAKGLSAAEKWMIGLNTAALALLVTPVPGGRIAAGVTALAGRAIAPAIKAGQGLKGAWQARKANRLMKMGQKELVKTGKVPPSTVPYNPNVVLEAGKQQLKRRVKKGLGATALTATTLPFWLRGSDEEKEKEEIVIDESKKEIDKILEPYNKIVAQGLSGPKDSNTKYLKQANALDVAQLGGILMGATSMSELGKGIAGLASNIQDRKTTSKLADIQGNLYKAQTAKYEADVKNMPYDQLVTEFSAISKAYKTLVDQAGDSEELADYVLYLDALRNQMAALRGIDLEASGINKLKSFGITVD